MYLRRCSSFASANGPDRFVGEDNVLPRFDLVRDCLGLAVDDSFSLTSLAFVQLLANASDDLQAGFQGMDAFVGYQLCENSMENIPFRKIHFTASSLRTSFMT